MGAVILLLRGRNAYQHGDSIWASLGVVWTLGRSRNRVGTVSFSWLILVSWRLSDFVDWLGSCWWKGSSSPMPTGKSPSKKRSGETSALELELFAIHLAEPSNSSMICIFL